MSKLSEIEPQDKPNLIDLVKAAGVDVSDWANCNTIASRNPKYCYEWAFVEPNKVVVLNLWYGLMEKKNGGIIMRKFNMRGYADSVDEPSKTRALRFDDAIKTAVTGKLPIRVIVGKEKSPGIYETVFKRLLDPVNWTVAAYDLKTGDCILTRGIEKFVDQFSIQPESPQKPERREFTGQAFVRSPVVRSNVLLRADGHCEWCGRRGFLMADGRIYLETHHVIPLSEEGSDTESNVAALCPNHHREAHHGVKRVEMRKKLLRRLL